jgi:hypothetical protein
MAGPPCLKSGIETEDELAGFDDSQNVEPEGKQLLAKTCLPE